MLELAAVLLLGVLLLLEVVVVHKPVGIFDRFFIISDSYLAAKDKADDDGEL